MNAQLKPIPSLSSDEEAEDFVANADLSEYDLSQFKPMGFEITKKDASLNMRMPVGLMEALRSKAKAHGLPYSRYVRMLLEADLQRG